MATPTRGQPQPTLGKDRTKGALTNPNAPAAIASEISEISWQSPLAWRAWRGHRERDPIIIPDTCHRTKFKSRSYRMAKGHFQTSHQAAEESIDKNSISAGPIRFSVGTWPTSAVRLSKESSRLSPIMK